MSTRDVLDTIDGALRDYETSADAMRWTPDAPPSVQIELGQLVDLEALAEFSRRLSAVFSQITVSLGTFCLQLTKLSAVIVHMSLAEDRKHRARCGTCNPAGNPPPCPGMRDYQRRVRARARRAGRR